MKKKIKIFYLLVLVLFVSPTICLAKSIRINNTSYNVEDILEGENYIYDAKNDTLTLKNANLQTIKTTNNLKIVLDGDNYLNNDSSVLDAISAKKLEIIGEGSLIINSKYRGIDAEKILVNNTNINIKSEKDAFCTSSSSNYDLIINNSNLKLETNEEAFNIVDGDIYLNNSNIEIIKAKQLTSSFGKYTYLNNTNLNIREIDTINYNSYYVYVNGISNINVHAINNRFLSNNYKLDKNLTILGSDDGINYQGINDTSKDKYIKITSNLDLDLLFNKEKELKELEEKIKNKEKEIDLYEKRLLKMEEEISLTKDNLKEYEGVLKEKELSLEKKEVDLKLLEDDLLKEIANNANLKVNLDKKEEEIKKIEINLNKEREELKNGCKNIVLSNKESVDTMKNPKTFNSLKGTVVSLVVSFLGIIFLVLKIRKKEFLDG